jgi:hypothetical protein
VTLDAGIRGVLGVERFGAGEQEVAVGQVESAGVAVVRVLSRQHARLLRLQVDFVDVSKSLFQEVAFQG